MRPGPLPVTTVQRQNRPAGAAPLSPEEAEAKRQFLGQRFSKPNHRPDLGGMFDLEYVPGAGQLTVTVKIAFDFRDVPPETVPKALRPYCAWAADEKTRWQQALCGRVAARWSGKATINCTKPGWEDVRAAPQVRVVAVGGADAHFHATVYKEVGGKVQAGVSGQNVDFSESNIRPEHETDANESAAKRKQMVEQEKQRLETALAESGPPR